MCGTSRCREIWPFWARRVCAAHPLGVNPVRDPSLPRAARAGALVTQAKPWAISFLGALVSVSLPIGVYQVGGSPLLVQLALLLPAVVTLVLLRQGRTWYRWVAVLALAQVVYSEMLTLVLLVSFTWVIRQAWFVEERVWRFGRRADAVKRPRRTSPRRGGAAK